MNIFLCILIASLIEFVGDANFKVFARTGRWSNLTMGLVVYLAMIAIIIHVLRSTNVMFTNLAWDGMSALIETILAFILLHETLSNGIQWAGGVLIIFGLIGLSYGVAPAA